MLAYNKTTLNNLFVHAEAEDALRYECITPGQFKTIHDEHPVDLYTPGIFVRIGLGVLTVIIILVSAGLLALLFELYNSIAAFLVFFGLLCYGMLEVMAGKRHFNSGVDNVLIISAAGFVIGGIAAGTYITGGIMYLIAMSLVAAAIFLFLAARFADSIMAVAAVASLLVFIFYTYISLGAFTQASFPFILIAFSSIIYYLATKAPRSPLGIYYNFVFKAVRVTALLAIYCSGNFFIVSEVSHAVFDPLAETALPLTLGWFFWTWTLLVPFVYLVKGVRDKDSVFIRTGMILIAVALVTFRSYYTVISLEGIITIVGILAILVSFILIKYLRNAKHGYTFRSRDHDKKTRLNLEGLIISEAFGNRAAAPAQQDTNFGGGSFGGAGSGDTY